MRILVWLLRYQSVYCVFFLSSFFKATRHARPPAIANFWPIGQILTCTSIRSIYQIYQQNNISISIDIFRLIQHFIGCHRFSHRLSMCQYVEIYQLEWISLGTNFNSFWRNMSKYVGTFQIFFFHYLCDILCAIKAHLAACNLAYKNHSHQ